MPEERFSRSEALRFGWQAMKENFWFLAGILVLSWIIIAIPNGISEIFKKQNPVLYFIFQVIAQVIGIILSIGFTRLALKLSNKEPIALSDLFASSNLFLEFLFASILYSLIILGGLILLIVPGIIWMVTFQFFSYFIVDKKLGPIEALKKSAQITKGVKLDLFIFAILIFGINILGALALLIGLFATLSTTAIAMAFVYRKLASQADPPQSRTVSI